MIKENIKLLLSLNQERKYFLLVWSIIFFLISIGFFGSIGRTVIEIEYTSIGSIGVGERQMVFNDLVVPFLVLILFSFVLYIIVGLKPIKTIKR